MDGVCTIIIKFYRRLVVLMEQQGLVNRTLMLIARLERISADSIWAHRASGLRGSLLRGLELVKNGGEKTEVAQLSAAVEQGYHLLEQAAREIPDMDKLVKS